MAKTIPVLSEQSKCDSGLDADLSDPVVLLAVLCCTGLRYDMFDFLSEIKLDLIQLPDIFPLLISSLWKDDVHKEFFKALGKLRDDEKHELVAAILQLPPYCNPAVLIYLEEQYDQCSPVQVAGLEDDIRLRPVQLPIRSRSRPIPPLAL
jgi:hypothetical protein